MQFNQASRGQGGFTLIELIVVIVILGILAATALPKFADLGGDARLAKINGARGAVSSAASIMRGRYLVANLSGAQTVDNVTLNASGFPTADAAGIGAAAGGLQDYVLTAGTGGTVTISVDSSHSTCSFVYTESTGTVNSAPAAANCK